MFTFAFMGRTGFDTGSEACNEHRWGYIQHSVTGNSQNKGVRVIDMNKRSAQGEYATVRLAA